jgi:hypothetical protein
MKYLWIALILVATTVHGFDIWIIQYGEVQPTPCPSFSKDIMTTQACFTSPIQTRCDTEDCVRKELLKGNATYVWKLTCNLGGMVYVPDNPCYAQEYDIITAKDIKPKPRDGWNWPGYQTRDASENLPMRHYQARDCCPNGYEWEGCHKCTKEER